MRDVLFSDDWVRIEWSDVRRANHLYGPKGTTSLAIPKDWTLPFALVSSSVVAQIDSNSRPLSFYLNNSEQQRILALAGAAVTLIIRSSVVNESIWDRGTYLSIPVNVAGANAIECLNAAAWEVIDSTKGRATGLMIQRYISPTTRGEFGNLLRISKTRDHWEVSTVDPAGLTTRVRLNCQRDEAANPDKPLLVQSGIGPERLFGPIGAWLNNELLHGRSQRLNCEWITDNNKYFLVQIDEEDEDVSGVNPFQVRIPPATRPSQSSGHFIKSADENALKNWDKLKVLDDLWEPDALDKPALFFVRVAELLNLDNATTVEKLKDDFRKLIGPEGIIVRTSVTVSSEKLPNLPRTEGLTPACAAQWCVDKATELKLHHNLKEIAFIIHRFVAARASAWVRAEPGNPIVQINSLWGLPDALQYCPYDIWEVHAPTRTATAYPEYKSDMLISNPDGSWKYVRIKNELARHNSIASVEAKDIAERSLSIAERLGRSCHIMWFVGCVHTNGPTFNIPWYWTEAHIAERNIDRTNYRITLVSDEESLGNFINFSGPRTRQALELCPDRLELMRDVNFILAVGNAAKDTGVPIILYGSTLAHAYYQLRKLGCVIVTPSEKDHSRVRRSANFGKLVRDKIPAKITARHEIGDSRRVTGKLRMGFLISKLFEEALEIREAFERPQKTEELADLFEVFRSIAKSEDIALEDIERVANQKKLKSGGFDDGLILLQTGISVPDRSTFPDLEKSLGDVLLDQVSDDLLEIPFSFFGFIKLNQSSSIYFERLNVRLDIVLRSDRLELKLVRSAEQLELPFSD
jgi:predicted house-cleaning noncanonical NTP pyrophosphatase (MazG superfamily)